MQEPTNRYTVQLAQLPGKDGLYKSYLILDDGLPAVEINQALIIKDHERQRPPSTERYALCHYLNWLDSQGVHYSQATMQMIYTYLSSNYMKNKWSYGYLEDHIVVIAKLYESLTINGFALDPSLYVPMKGVVPTTIRNEREAPSTKIWALKYVFKPRCNTSMQSYTKWYTAAQIEAIKNELPLPHRIIFLFTVYFGLRASSAISVKLSSLNLKKKQFEPTYSKTKRTHISTMPDELVKLVQSYLEGERSQNKGSGSDYLFLNNRGQPMSYANYRDALKRAGARVRQERPDLDLGDVHTHAGRSTFAATLRSYQLNQQRLGKPTFTDADFCMLMDWKNLKSLEHYDKATRIQDVYPLFEEFYAHYNAALNSNNMIFCETNKTKI